jgi:putative restriction endonuclease
MEGHHYYESGLRKPDGSTNKGAFGRAVRNVSDSEYDAILAAGFAHVLGRAERPRPAPDVPEAPWLPLMGAAEDPAPYGDEEFGIGERPIVEQLVRRPFRERAFATAVKSAYRDTCAMTGLKIINGSGRSEVQAAHIRAVAENGPDSVRNGMALSSTMHWMFDRGLISIDEDFRLLVAPSRVPDLVERMLVPDRKLRLPSRRDLHPHPEFLKWHRDNVFKG